MLHLGGYELKFLIIGQMHYQKYVMSDRLGSKSKIYKPNRAVTNEKYRQMQANLNDQVYFERLL